VHYAEFFESFGGSYRTKHIERGLPERLANRAGAADGGRVSRWASRAVRAARADLRPAAARFIARRRAAIARPFAPRADERRRHRLPARSGLPPEFIRLDPWEGEYLYEVARQARVGVVETGRLRGGSTFLLASANPKVPISSIDIAPKDDAALHSLMRRHDVGANVQLIVGDSQQGLYPEIREIDLLFVDGDHSYDGCLADLRNWYPKLVAGGHVLLHDCYRGSEVQPATIDFLEDEAVEVVREPHVQAIHWQTPIGSLAHFIKAS
jgi:predicted O-methyltransferase YrrM